MVRLSRRIRSLRCEPVTCGVLAFILPILVVPLELFIPIPWLIEEGAKYLFLRSIGWKDNNGGAYQPILYGVIFGISEGLMFLPNAIQLGSLQPLFFRMLLTVPMHALTMGVIGIGMTLKGWKTVAAVVVAMALHFFFNLIVAYGVWL